VSVLYPRLLPSEAERLFSSLHGHGPEELSRFASVTSERTTFSATGGTRVRRDDLRLLTTDLEKIAAECGYPSPPDAQSRNFFDRAVGRHLHERSGMAPGEASQRQVWAFMALVLVPHLCAWRYPMAGGTYQADRFKGTDLTRHTLARAWMRAHVLHDPTAGEPYGLLSLLGEADIDQIMARRRALAATPQLVQAIVRVHSSADSEASGGIPSRLVLRDVLKRLLRLTAFLDLDWMSDEALRDLVRQERNESIRLLAEAGSDDGAEAFDEGP
jgi:hypothetical protein